MGENLKRAIDTPPGNLSSTAWGIAAALGGESSHDADLILEASTPEEVIASLEEALSGFRRAGTPAESESLRAVLLRLCDAGRRPVFLRRISGTPLGARWLGAVLETIDAADLTLLDLLHLRAVQSPERTIVRILEPRSVQEVSRGRLAERVCDLAAGLLRLLPAHPGRVPVAILAPNRIETILVDLACLTHGMANVPIATDSTPDQVRFILEATRPVMLVVSDATRLERVLAGGPLPSVQTILLMDPPEDERLPKGTRVQSEVEKEGREWGPGIVPRVHARDMATIMFTSGTTGRPKGIRFSQRNIVYKRFCRAVAIPEIGEEDRFLCYLPLFHTFGRWLEMTGTLFWGAYYVGLQDSSAEAMFDAMKKIRPSVFISIPKRWIQIHEKILRTVGEGSHRTEPPVPAEVQSAVHAVTGGALKWGLSAAGHLDSDIFLFFQRHGIELMSGFGMTEATGGITMTPPGAYRRGTVGVPLPGIEVTRAEDGELLIRGPYMMLGYDDPDEPDRNYEVDWLPTGDLVGQDQDGYITIVDRKKDIYKNVKGQTIAPQRIENLFNEFEEIKRTFLVGDGREYNTLLIYPDYDAAEGKLARMSRETLREYLSSFVVSVNRFLAPYERVVDFDLLPRYFREDRGELTPKGTFVRKVVEQNFKDLVDGLYARSYVGVHVEGTEVRVPAWLLRAKGLTSDAPVSEPGGIRLRPTGERLAVARMGSSRARVRVGSFIYGINADARGVGSPTVVDLDTLLRVPRYWVGNAELARFAGEDLLRKRAGATIPGERLVPEGWQRTSLLLLDEIRKRFIAGQKHGDRGPHAVHCAAGLLFGTEGDQATWAMDALEEFLQDRGSEESVLTAGILLLLRFHNDSGVRRRALTLLVPREVDAGAAETLRRFLAVDPDILVPEVVDKILAHDIPSPAIRSILDLAEFLDAGPDQIARPAGTKRIAALLRLVTEIASRHPRWYVLARRVLVRRAEPDQDPGIVRAAAEDRTLLNRSFRSWIDAGSAAPPEPGAGEERVDWEEVVEFDERVGESLRERLMIAFRETTLLCESIFLLGDASLLSRDDLPPGGIWVSFLGSGHDKQVVRLAVRTRSGRQYDFVVKAATGLSPEDLSLQADWMIRLGSGERAVRLVPDFGGIWPEALLWTEEFVSGETVAAHIRRSTGGGDPERIQRLVASWPHIAWSALTAFVEFWRRTGRRDVMAEPTPDNIVVATHDYQEGSRLVSVSSTAPFAGIPRMLRYSYEEFVEATERNVPALQGAAPRRLAFGGFIEALGEAVAIPLLWRALSELRELSTRGGDPVWKLWHDDLASTLDEVERDGYAPRRLAMAVRRYHNWAGLNPGSSLTARAMMLLELYETYGLTGLEPRHPELRVRFFRMTVFAGASGPLAGELDALVRAHRDVPLSVEALLRRMTLLHQSCSLGEEEIYFLARMTYSHLTPAQSVRLELLEEGGETVAELVEEFRDEDGSLFKVRAPASPKEVMRLHHLFEQSGLTVVFRAEHRFLVVIDDQETVAGGLFFRPAEHRTVHMEKIVVNPRHRGKGVGERVMDSFMQRMRDAGHGRVTTGFFRPHYFYQFGFRLERGFAGLVKDLDTERGSGA